MTTTTIRMDEVVLAELKDLAKEMGISFTTLANAALKKVLQERRVEISAPSYTLSPEYEKELINDPDVHETVFVAEKQGDSRRFLTSLQSRRI